MDECMDIMERGQETKEVYLPTGAKWTNVWTKETFEGGQTVTVKTPLEQIPLFTKDGFRQETKEVYLPTGAKWTNVWTKETFEGGQTVTVKTPLEQIPLFTKDGFILNI